MEITPKQAFLQVCSMTRLEAILGNKDRALSFVSDFLTIADKYNKGQYEGLAKCAVEVASINLSLLPQLGQAYLVPRGGALNLEIGYRGWELLAKRAGFYIRHYPVFKGDTFELKNEGFNQNIYHVPLQENLVADRNDEFIANNLLFFVVIIRDMSTGLDSVSTINYSLLRKLQSTGNGGGAYKNWLFEMYQAKAIKYALRKISFEALGPIAYQINRALETDDKNDIAHARIEQSKKTGELMISDAFASAKVKQSEVEIEEVEIDEIK